MSADRVDPLELDTRRRLYQHLAAHPGKHLRELQRDLAMGMGALEYHLGFLADAGLVTAQQHAHKRFFPAAMDPQDRRVLAFLRQDLPRRTLLLLTQGEKSKAELVAALDVPPSTLNHHLRHLVDAGLVAEGRVGRDATYRLPDAARVVRLLVTYRAGFLDRMVEGFLAGTDALR